MRGRFAHELGSTKLKSPRSLGGFRFPSPFALSSRATSFRVSNDESRDPWLHLAHRSLRSNLSGKSTNPKGSTVLLHDSFRSGSNWSTMSRSTRSSRSFRRSSSRRFSSSSRCSRPSLIATSAAQSTSATRTIPNARSARSPSPRPQSTVAGNTVPDSPARSSPALPPAAQSRPQTPHQN